MGGAGFDGGQAGGASDPPLFISGPSTATSSDRVGGQAPAIQSKLDELLKVNHDAGNAVTRIDDKEPEEIEQFREEQRRGIEG